MARDLGVDPTSFNFVGDAIVKLLRRHCALPGVQVLLLSASPPAAAAAAAPARQPRREGFLPKLLISRPANGCIGLVLGMTWS